MNRYSLVGPIATPLLEAAGVRGTGVANALGSPGSITGSDGEVVIAIGVVCLLAIGLFVLLRKSSDEGGAAPPPESPESSEEATRQERRDDHDVVRDVLSARGGRTRQSVIVEETGWSKAKVSAVLAEMDEAGAVSKLRVGRENIVSLPGHEPDAVDSAIED